MLALHFEHIAITIQRISIMKTMLVHNTKRDHAKQVQPSGYEKRLISTYRVGVAGSASSSPALCRLGSIRVETRPARLVRLRFLPHRDSRCLSGEDRTLRRGLTVSSRLALDTGHRPLCTIARNDKLELYAWKLLSPVKLIKLDKRGSRCHCFDWNTQGSSRPRF